MRHPILVLSLSFSLLLLNDFRALAQQAPVSAPAAAHLPTATPTHDPEDDEPKIGRLTQEEAQKAGSVLELLVEPQYRDEDSFDFKHVVYLTNRSQRTLDVSTRTESCWNADAKFRGVVLKPGQKLCIGEVTQRKTADDRQRWTYKLKFYYRDHTGPVPPMSEKFTPAMADQFPFSYFGDIITMDTTPLEEPGNENNGEIIYLTNHYHKPMDVKCTMEHPLNCDYEALSATIQPRERIRMGIARLKAKNLEWNWWFSWKTSKHVDPTPAPK